MAYRVNGVECDTPEEVLKLLEKSRSTKVELSAGINRASAQGLHSPGCVQTGTDFSNCWCGGGSSHQ